MRINATVLPWVVGLASALISSMASAIDTAPPTWKPRELVTTTSYLSAHVGANRILAYDHHGNAGIAFNSGGSYLAFARRVAGIGWASSPVLYYGGYFPSLAFDRYERPAISHSYGSSPSALYFSYFDGTSWQSTDPVEGSNNTHSSLAFDVYGNPAISFSKNTNELWFAEDSDGDGIPETPSDWVAGTGHETSLAFDHLNRPMIASYSTAGSDLSFSVWDTGLGWVTTTVDAAGDTGKHPSLAIDPDTGFPAIAYFDVDNADLRYAEWTGDDWSITTIDSAGSTGWYPSLAFDPADGNPAIAYFNDDNDDLMLAWQDGSNWQTQVVDSVGNVGFTPSLAFNDYGNGFPSIAYFDDGGDLYFIEDPPAMPEPGTLTLLLIGMIGCSRPRRRGLP